LSVSSVTCLRKQQRLMVLQVKILLQNLECRLDNVVFRMGIAPTRAAARQLVGHKHITLLMGKLYQYLLILLNQVRLLVFVRKQNHLEVIEQLCRI
jgi:small subunit ribosomal protein S4